MSVCVCECVWVCVGVYIDVQVFMLVKMDVGERDVWTSRSECVSKLAMPMGGGRKTGAPAEAEGRCWGLLSQFRPTRSV